MFDRNGNVIGIVVSKLNALKVAELIGDIPQNINFAPSKASAAAAFLEKLIASNMTMKRAPMHFRRPTLPIWPRRSRYKLSVWQ